jgi:sulfite exporter TauE/SafE
MELAITVILLCVWLSIMARFITKFLRVNLSKLSKAKLLKNAEKIYFLSFAIKQLPCLLVHLFSSDYF